MYTKRVESDSKVGEAASEKEKLPPTMYYLKQRKILVNLTMMSVVWMATMFGYYLILTLVNSFSKIYISGLTSSFSEMVGYVLSGLFAEQIGPKLSLIISFLISAVGGILILVWGL